MGSPQTELIERSILTKLIKCFGILAVFLMTVVNIEVKH